MVTSKTSDSYINHQIIGGYFMSQDEEMAARGGLVTTYAETRNRLATLKAEAMRIGKQLEEIAYLLQNQPELAVFTGQAVTGRHPGARVFDPIANDAAKLPALVDEIRTTATDLERLRERVAELGLDI